MWVAALTSTSAAALSVLRLARLERERLRDAAELRASLARTPREERLEELMRRDDWLGALAAELAESPDGARQIAALNLELDERAAVLDAGATWPRVALRLALAGALLAGALAVLLHQLPALLPILIVGAAGALVSFEGGRRAARLAREDRAAIDAVVDLIAPSLAEPTTVPRPARGRHRRRRSS